MPNLKSLICTLVCTVVVSLFTYGYWLYPTFSWNEENTMSVYHHAPNDDSKLPTPSEEYIWDTSHCELCMPAQLLPLTAVQGCFYMFKITAVAPLVQICRNRHWRWRVVKDSEMIIFKMKQLLYNNSLFILHETPTAFHHSFIRKMTGSKRQLVASISKSYKIFGTKMAQLIYSRRLVSLFGCTLDQLKFIPKSFLASEESDCFDFFSYAAKRLKTKWILKPYGGVCGYGIEFYPDTSSMVTRLNHKCGVKSDWRENQYIIQEYLPNLLLLNGRKFDIRAFILIARTDPYFLYYHPGYLRVAMAKHTKAAGKAAQLTNTHVQGSIDGFSPEEHFWTFVRLQQYISNISSGNDDFVQTILEPFIKKTGLFWLQAGQWYTYSNIVYIIHFNKKTMFFLYLHELASYNFKACN